MIELKDYLFGKLNRVDCHVNLVGINSMENYTGFADDSIVMVNNALMYSDESLAKYVDELYKIRKDKHVNFHIAHIGKDANELLEICKKYPTEFIGEVKCYKHFVDNEKHEEHKVIDTSIALDKNFANIPMFVHVDLINDEAQKILEEILSLNLDRPVILCHCGINKLDDKDSAFERAITLQHKYNNLWFEISWTAWDYIGKDHRIMSRVDTDRVLLGTDFSKYTTKEVIESTLSYIDYWSKKISLRRNIIKLLRSEGQPQLNNY